MVSRSETARPLLTPGEVMQLPQDDEIVMVAGVPPIRTTKARYYEDVRLKLRVLPTPESGEPGDPRYADDWSNAVPSAVDDRADECALGAKRVPSDIAEGTDDEANAGLRREPGLEAHKDIAPEADKTSFNEFDLDADEPEWDALSARALTRRMRQVAGQASLDPNDSVEL